MATQSLYRRFRPRKFSELYGQEHVVRALRNAVINGREGQAYLFSGPRGTGKTTTARILAKVLNCENPVDGEPCCACQSCLAVEQGTSYDVLELDAASNNGDQEIRDIIDAAALTSPGRHRVFILDEVHMLTRAAEAALLKTLEEPPAQVVFVLATTDPQKVSETIRSRVQHLQFHLIPADELEKYVRFVIEKADLDVNDESIAHVLRQGGGSARDTLSALELVAAGGGEPEEALHTEGIIRGIVARDHGQALAAVALAMQQGRDAHTFAQDVVRTMRDCFLSIMSPELVQLPSQRVEELAVIARELGVQRIVRIMETLGTTMVEMRHAPDARLLLEVAVVQLASPAFDDSQEGMLARISQLEEAVKQLREKGVAAAVPPPPINPTTGRAKVGGLAQVADTTGPLSRDVVGTSAASDAVGTLASSNVPPASAPAAPTTSTKVSSESPPADITTPTPQPASQPTADQASGDPAQMWPQITDAMKGLAKAMFKPAVVESVDGKKVTVRLPANTPMKRATEHVPTLVNAMQQICGGTYVVTLTQADATGGIERPQVVPDEPKTIDKIVAEDPYAPVDIAETVIASDAVDPLLEALQNTFPQGAVIDEEVEVDTTTSQKQTRGKK